jgi:hypothetical protein
MESGCIYHYYLPMKWVGIRIIWNVIFDRANFFWILDFGFWILDYFSVQNLALCGQNKCGQNKRGQNKSKIVNPKSKIQNPKSFGGLAIAADTKPLDGGFPLKFGTRSQMFL